MLHNITLGMLLVEVRRFELLAPCVQGRCSPAELYPQGFTSYSFDLLISCLLGLDGLEPSTSRLSGARSNHLSYKPI